MMLDSIFNRAQVEIVMGLEEAFGITVDESSAQEIKTVEDAANLIDDLVKQKGAWKQHEDFFSASYLDNFAAGAAAELSFVVVL